MTETYANVIRLTEGMVSDRVSQQLAGKHGLQLLNVTWEDTARFKGSAVGPNISDMTIQDQRTVPGTGRYELTCMPVLRYPNFADLSADISPDRFFVLVGNEKGRPLEKVSLRQLLGDLRRHLHDPASWKGERTSLLAPERDSHVLVSAQDSLKRRKEFARQRAASKRNGFHAALDAAKQRGLNNAALYRHLRRWLNEAYPDPK